MGAGTATSAPGCGRSSGCATRFQFMEVATSCPLKARDHRLPGRGALRRARASSPTRPRVSAPLGRLRRGSSLGATGAARLTGAPPSPREEVAPCSCNLSIHYPRPELRARSDRLDAPLRRRRGWNARPAARRDPQRRDARRDSSASMVWTSRAGLGGRHRRAREPPSQTTTSICGRRRDGPRCEARRRCEPARPPGGAAQPRRSCTSRRPLRGASSRHVSLRRASHEEAPRSAPRPARGGHNIWVATVAARRHAQRLDQRLRRPARRRATCTSPTCSATRRARTSSTTRASPWASTTPSARSPCRSRVAPSSSTTARCSTGSATSWRKISEKLSLPPVKYVVQASRSSRSGTWARGRTPAKSSPGAQRTATARSVRARRRSADASRGLVR